MRDKLTYHKNRHKDIRINGKKAKMLGHSFFTHHYDHAECILLKTKIPGNYPTDLVCDQRRTFVLEIPTEEGLMTIHGNIRSIMSAPNMAEYGFEIVSKTISAI